MGRKQILWPHEEMEVTGMDEWIEDEIKGCGFKDKRHGKRLYKVIRSLSGNMGKAIPLACQDWAGTKAAYRLLDNQEVDESVILGGHFASTRSRFAASPGIAFILHDTTEFSYKRAHPEQIGKVYKTFVGKWKEGRP